MSTTSNESVDDRMSICYLASKYRSHARAARDYRNILLSHFSVSHDLDSSVVILHIEPHNYQELFEKYPQLKSKYVIAFCVWEADPLPTTYRASLKLVQEVWTCSRYCQQVIGQHHPNVVYVPHLVQRNLDFSAQDMAKVKQLISFSDDHCYFLHLTRMWDKRKNTEALMRLFPTLANDLPAARLIVKDSQQKRRRAYSDGNICYLGMHLTDSELNALYSLSACYVSPHHAEGWGFTMSDAMLFGKPVIATGYSGNLEYMNYEGSLLVAYTEANIAPNDRYKLFDSTMSWAYPDSADLVRKLTWLYEHRTHSSIHELGIKATASVERFNNDYVGGIMFKRLADILHLAISRNSTVSNSPGHS